MITLFTGFAITFVTLVVSATIIHFPKQYGKFLAASVVFSVLSVLPLPVGLIDSFLPLVGMYVVLIGTDYQSHEKIMKLCIVHFCLNLLIIAVTIFY